MSSPIDVLLTPRFFDSPWGPPKSTKQHSPFGYEEANWNMVPTWHEKHHIPYGSPQAGVKSSTPWNSPKPLETPTEPPTVITISSHWDDDVSVLNDDPDEDDDQLLPRSTYDVLAPLLDAMYNDESEAAFENDGAGENAAGEADDWEEQEGMGNGARAA
mmetsp:Transcript_141503/g.200413  ORF Transcript_141503/g.200413 Transcript_141503/m.200413 type:complete len:159 (+) Transcript_141503:220-696(+)